MLLPLGTHQRTDPIASSSFVVVVVSSNVVGRPRSAVHMPAQVAQAMFSLPELIWSEKSGRKDSNLQPPPDGAVAYQVCMLLPLGAGK